MIQPISITPSSTNYYDSGSRALMVTTLSYECDICWSLYRVATSLKKSLNFILILEILEKSLRGHPGVQQHYGATWTILPIQMCYIGHGKPLTHGRVG